MIIIYTIIMIITSQRYIDEEIVKEKLAAEDFEVMLSPSFEIDGEIYQVILDGHHSWHAAKAAGVEPSYWVAECCDHDAIGLLDQGKEELFLETVWMDSEYYDIETGSDVWA